MRERKLTRTLFLVACGSLITFLPEIVYWGSCASSPELVFSSLNQPLFNYLMATKTFVAANSLINPIIYAIRMPEVRTSMLEIIFRRARNPINPIAFPTSKSLNIYLKVQKNLRKGGKSGGFFTDLILLRVPSDFQSFHRNIYTCTHIFINSVQQ